MSPYEKTIMVESTLEAKNTKEVKMLQMFFCLV